MISIEDVEKLALLARIKLEEDEKKSLTKEIDSILTYVDQIKKATVDMDYTPQPGAIHNVTREDVAHSFDNREALLKEAPQREGDFIAVKKIIAQD